MGKDYYHILGVDKGASQEDIKKAFRAKAHQYHPDKQGGDEAKFKEVNEAYQVLGDQNKRAQYDQYGSAFEQAQSGGGFRGFEGFRDFSGFANSFGQGGFSFDPSDLGDIFGEMFGSRGGSAGGGRSARGRDLQISFTIDFLEAVFGIAKDITLEKKVACGTCHGSGAEPGSTPENCKTCNGSGRITRTQQSIFGTVQVQAVCPQCRGEGRVITKPCRDCSGRGTRVERSTISVSIPAGINDGETVRLSGQGEAGERGAQAGDLYISVRVRSDKRFVREGYDIKTAAAIGFTQAALGATIDVATVDGPVELKVPSGTQPGAIFKLKGKGVPKLKGSGRGDHYVTVSVKVPTSLSRKQRQMLEEAGI